MIDLLTQLEDGTTMSPLTATALSTEHLDLSTVARDIAQGTDLHANCTVTTAAAGSAGATVELQLLGMPVTTLAGLTSTITVAATDTITWTGHGLPAGTAVQFTTTGTLPTGLTPNQTYFVSTSGLGTDTFKVSTTLDGALDGSVHSITSGTGTGTHTGTALPIVMASSGALPYELLTVGSVVKLILNPAMNYGTSIGEQVERPGMPYLFARYVVGGTVTGGKFQVDVRLGHQGGRKHYASGLAVQ